LAAGNPTWGYQRIRGELFKLGHDVSATAIRTALRRTGVPPAPRRAGLTWSAFLRAHAGAVLECDFLTVETLRLRTLHVLFFLEVRSRSRGNATSSRCRGSTSSVTTLAGRALHVGADQVGVGRLGEGHLDRRDAGGRGRLEAVARCWAARPARPRSAW
jgi:hypothetical protein